jgi:RNA polymerase sigma-70 factor (ECF subfamily)
MLELNELYTEYKPLLISVAYRMTGSLSDAEDLVQDVFVAVKQAPIDRIEHQKAYLVKMVTNRSLNFLKSARRKREMYVGPWLPEPQITAAADEQDPAYITLQKEEVSYALLVLLEKLTPSERAVFVLRDIFDYEYADLASMLDKTEVNCRKIYSRAAAKMNGESAGASLSNMDTEPLVHSFIQAAHTGSFDAFIGMLTEDAVLLSDGGGKVRAAIRPITGRLRVHSFLQGIYGRGSLGGSWEMVRMNGQAGLVCKMDGKVEWVLMFGRNEEQTGFNRVYLIRNPDKLSHVE